MNCFFLNHFNYWIGLFCNNRFLLRFLRLVNNFIFIFNLMCLMLIIRNLLIRTDFEEKFMSLPDDFLNLLKIGLKLSPSRSK